MKKRKKIGIFFIAIYSFPYSHNINWTEIKYNFLKMFIPYYNNTQSNDDQFLLVN